MLRILIILLIIVLLSIFSCEEINLAESDPNVPIIESYITPGNFLSVKIFKQLIFDSNDTTIEYLNGLNVKISDGQTLYELQETENGIYNSHEIDILAEQSLSLEFEYNDKLVSSQTIIPSKPQEFSASANTIEVFSMSGGFPGSLPEPIDLTWSNPNEEYHMIVVENIEEEPVLVNEDIEEPRRAFRNAPTKGTTQELRPMTFMYYGQHRIILFKLNPEYAALYEQLGTSSLDITAPPSNIENGLGIFTGVNSDTLFVSVVSP